jgi:hypothetical protein
MPARPARVTYANVMSTVAVVLALSGTAVAGTLVTSADVKNNSLKSADLKNNAAVTSVDVKDGSLTGADVDESSLGKVPAAKKADQATQASHADQADQATDADFAMEAFSAETADSADVADEAALAAHAETASSAPLSGYQRVYSGDKAVAAGQVTTYDADCPVDKVAIAGGFYTSHGDVETMWGYVIDDDTYRVAFWNTNGSTARTVGVHVVCADEVA